MFSWIGGLGSGDFLGFMVVWKEVGERFFFYYYFCS